MVVSFLILASNLMQGAFRLFRLYALFLFRLRWLLVVFGAQCAPVFYWCVCCYGCGLAAPWPAPAGVAAARKIALTLRSFAVSAGGRTAAELSAPLPAIGGDNAGGAP